MNAAAGGNGNGGLIAGISDKLIRALPPAMLLLVAFNVLTLGAMLYVVQHNMTARNAMIQQIVTSCLRTQP
jgi:hypothetical protein